jgi:hypothetical protein
MKYCLQETNENWNPLQVRDLVQRARMDGHSPKRLSLGHREALQLRVHLLQNFSEPVPATLAETYYLGLKVEEVDTDHLVALDGEYPELDSQDDTSDKLGASPEPDFKVPSEMQLGHRWDSKALRDLIDHKSTVGRTPAFLFIGHHEAYLLRKHLGAAFGPENVQTLRNLYYMGLEVMEVETDYFLRTAGMKRVKDFAREVGRHPVWEDIQKGSIWSLSFFK